MAEEIGLKGVFDLVGFNAGIGQYLSKINLASAATGVAERALGAFGQMTTGALREVGALATRGLAQAAQEASRFAAEIVSAAAAETPLVDTLASVRESLVDVTRTSFDPLFSQLDELVNQAAPTFLAVVQAAETEFSGLATDALGWGENIVNSLADGMYAAIGAVFDALANIGNLIASYLMPGSPPALLPDLDDWGTEAANVYLEGWTKADFSIFDELSGTLSNLIRSLPLGEGSELNVLERILGTREGVAQAVDEIQRAGEISSQTMEAIVGSVGSANDAVRDYVTAMVNAEAANQAVADAQAEVNRITQEYEDLLRPIDDELNAVDEAQQKLADQQRISQLQLVANDPNATLAEKELARLEIEKIGAAQRKRALATEKQQAVAIAQEKLDSAKDAQASAKEEFDAKKALIALQTEQNRLLQEQMRLLAQEAGGSGGGGAPKPPGGKGGGGGGFKIPKINWDEIFGGLDEKLSGVIGAFGSAWGAIIQTLQPAIDAFGNVQRAAGNLSDAIADSFPRMQEYIADMVAFVVTEMGINLPTIFNNVASGLDSLAGIWRRHGDTIMAVINFAFRVIVAVISTSLTAVSGLIAIALNNIEGLFDAASAALQGDWNAAFAAILLTVLDDMAIAQSTLDTMLSAITAIFGTNGETIKQTVSDAFYFVATLVMAQLTIIQGFVGIVLNSIEGLFVAAGALIMGDWETALTTIVTTTFENTQIAQDTIESALSAILEFFGASLDEVEALWSAAWLGLNTALATEWANIITTINSGIDQAKKAISDSVSAFTALGGDIIDGVKSGIEAAVAGLAAAAAGAAGSALSAAKAALGISSPSRKAANLVGAPFMQGIAQGITGQMGELTRLVQSVGGRMVQSAAASAVTYNNSSATNFTYAPTYGSAPPSVSDNFALMMALAGGN